MNVVRRVVTVWPLVLVAALPLVRRRPMVAILVGCAVVRWLMITVPVPVLVRCWWPVVIAGITMVSVAPIIIVILPVVPIPVAIMAPRIKNRSQNHIVGFDAIAGIAGIAGKIRIDRLAVGIDGDLAMAAVIGLIDGEFEAAVERELGPDDLIGRFRTLHQVLAAVDVAFRDEVGDDVLTPLDQLLGGKLVGFVHQGEQGQGTAAAQGRWRRWLILSLGGAARTEQGVRAEKNRQKHEGKFHC